MTAPSDPIRSAALEEAARIAEDHIGAAARHRRAKNIASTPDIRAEERGEDIAAEIIAKAIRALTATAVEPVAWQPFNINHEVRVKLTDVGRAAHRRNHNELFWPHADKIAYTPPVEDADGWSTWQLWELMHELGKLCRNGAKVPFETEIEFKRPAPPSFENHAAPRDGEEK